MKPHWTEEDYKRVLKNRMGGSVRKGAMLSSDTPRVIASARSSYRSQWEEKYAAMLNLELRANIIRSWHYEGITFTLAKHQYHRIDFVIGHIDGTVELAQIKGRWHKNIRAGMKGLKWAAQLFPMFIWTLKRLEGTLWHSERVEI